jgi:hypothetical protein
VPRFVNDAHTALPEPFFQMIFSFENGFAADALDGRHSIVRTGIDLIGVTSFTNLTLFHLDFRYGEKLFFVLFMSAKSSDGILLQNFFLLILVRLSISSKVKTINAD